MKSLGARTAVALAEELSRLEAEIRMIQRRIAAGRGGIVDHILLEATRRTHAITLQALQERDLIRDTLPGVGELNTIAPPRAARDGRAISGMQPRASKGSNEGYWIKGTGDAARTADTWRPARAGRAS